MNERLGEINKNKFGTEMKIIAYRKSDDIDISFDPSDTLDFGKSRLKIHMIEIFVV